MCFVWWRCADPCPSVTSAPRFLHVTKKNRWCRLCLISCEHVAFSAMFPFLALRPKELCQSCASLCRPECEQCRRIWVTHPPLRPDLHDSKQFCRHTPTCVFCGGFLLTPTISLSPALKIIFMMTESDPPCQRCLINCGNDTFLAFSHFGLAQNTDPRQGGGQTLNLGFGDVLISI